VFIENLHENVVYVRDDFFLARRFEALPDFAGTDRHNSYSFTRARNSVTALVPAAATSKPTKAKRKKDESPSDVVPVSQVECRQRLGGLLKHYYRKVA
jgi:hypothetical protein